MRKQHLQHGLLALALAAAASTAHAETQVVLGGLLTTGGDTLAAGTYSDGTDWRIRGGGFLHVFAGVEYRQPTSPVSVQATIGYHIDDTSASNGSITFSRFPAELLLLWQPQEWFRAGVGLRKSLGTHLSSSGVASMSVGSTDLNSQLGMVVQGEYLFNPHLSLVLRWVQEKYDVHGMDIDGNHVGAGLSVRF